MNNVDSYNFNETCEGYVKRALKESKTLSEKQNNEVLSNLCYALDVMSMSEARNYCNKY